MNDRPQDDREDPPAYEPPVAEDLDTVVLPAAVSAGAQTMN